MRRSSTASGTAMPGRSTRARAIHLYHTGHWRSAGSYVALSRQRESAQVFVARATARDTSALARHMARGDNKSTSLEILGDARELPKHGGAGQGRGAVRTRETRGAGPLGASEAAQARRERLRAALQERKTQARMGGAGVRRRRCRKCAPPDRAGRAVARHVRAGPGRQKARGAGRAGRTVARRACSGPSRGARASGGVPRPRPAGAGLPARSPRFAKGEHGAFGGTRRRARCRVPRGGPAGIAGSGCGVSGRFRLEQAGDDDR
jgi:hypothetical protein